MQQPATDGETGPDTERFRLRSFVELLIAHDQVEIHDDPVPLTTLARHLDGNEKAVLFRKAGPEQVEIVGNILGNRARIGYAFDLPREQVPEEINRRLRNPQPVVEISSADAPVHEVILTGDDADLTKLPVHLQHAMDGGPYISASVDYACDPETGHRNAGIRRMMLRGPKEAGVDLTAPSDLQAIFRKVQARGERLPISYVVGSHPIDLLSASLRLPGDEIEQLAALRGAPLAVVKGVTNDVLVPADAEMVLEGYLDPVGWSEEEGPFGEFLGYYGIMKRNPVFCLTAITRRRDALFQTATISGNRLANTDTAHIGTILTEVAVWESLKTAVREPVAVCATASSGGLFNTRVAIRQRVPGEARNAIAAVLGSIADTKNVFVVDDDVDVTSDSQMDWAMATRFQPDRDVIVQEGFRIIPLDPSLEGARTGAKAGFDLTLPFGKRDRVDMTVSVPPDLDNVTARFQTVEDALADGAKSFGELVASLGSDDGREVVRALDVLRTAGRLAREEEGQYRLSDSTTNG
ncbi:MAG: UbiD family decarboxylase [Rhodospirillaceae bacterium]|nr:UbiD family decarboxylase [Rhodospirillaceae bacterium]